MQFVAERFWPGVTEAAARSAISRVRESCIELAADGVPVRWLGGTLLAGDEVLSMRFEGTAQGVRAAHELAGVPLDRLLPSVDVESDEPTSTAQPTKEQS
jgi:hypothetical protein